MKKIDARDWLIAGGLIALSVGLGLVTGSLWGVVVGVGSGLIAAGALSFVLGVQGEVER